MWDESISTCIYIIAFVTIWRKQHPTFLTKLAKLLPLSLVARFAAFGVTLFPNYHVMEGYEGQCLLLGSKARDTRLCSNLAFCWQLSKEKASTPTNSSKTMSLWGNILKITRDVISCRVRGHSQADGCSTQLSYHSSSVLSDWEWHMLAWMRQNKTICSTRCALDTMVDPFQLLISINYIIVLKNPQ